MLNTIVVDGDMNIWWVTIDGDKVTLDAADQSGFNTISKAHYDEAVAAGGLVEYKAVQR